jgi:hypothetical protein
VTLLVFLAAAARTGIVAADLRLGAVHRLAVQEQVRVKLAMIVIMVVIMIVVAPGTVDVRGRGAARGSSC